MTNVRLTAGAIGLLIAAARLGQAPAVPPSIDRAEFPVFDQAPLSALEDGLRAKDMARLLVESPVDARLPGYLADHNRVDEALRILREIADRHPDRIAQGFLGFPRLGLRGDPRVQTTALAALIPAARSHLGSLPREQAAAAARILLNVEAQMDRSVPRQDRLRTFITEYTGTEAALAAEVDLISSETVPSTARFSALDDFAARHQGTCAAAKAIHQKGADLANNGSALGERRGADPTNRFQQLLGVVRDLEQNPAYPQSCDAVRDAPQLAISFYAYEPSYSPEHLQAMIDGYREFVLSHFALADRSPAANGVGYVIASKMGDLFSRQGDRVAGVEQVLSDLEHRVADVDAVRFLRAHFYIGLRGASGVDQAAMQSKAIDTLTQLHDTHRLPYARRALATLAGLYFSERNYSLARQTYEAYLSEYSRTEWSWLARIRLGQADVALDDLDAAARAFELATVPAAPVFWRVIAHAYASEAAAGLGRVDIALAHAERALSEWDDDFGVSYRVQASQRPLPTTEPFAIPNDMTVTKDQLRERVPQLTESAKFPGGAEAEQGRWLLTRHQTGAARLALEHAMARGRGTPIERTARALVHRASLDAALDAANADNPARDEAAALHALDELIAEPPDVTVLAAKIAKATLIARKDADAGDVLMRSALTDLTKLTPAEASAPASSLETDLIEIRNDVFRPLGGGVYGQKSWNAFTWPAQLPTFIVTRSDVDVQLAGETARRFVLRQPFPSLDHVIFLSNDELGLFGSIMKSLGGTGRRATTQVMETPNQPVGPSMEIRALWNRYFPMRQGHWSGWVFETYPIINRIEFTDSARTKALVAVEIGYAGGTVVMIKNGGQWRATDLINLWIT